MFDWQAIFLTLKLTITVTLVLLVVGTPIAWWLARTRHWLKQPIASVVALPLVLPPTVLGFYLLVLLSPNGPVGQFIQTIGLGVLPFTFQGLVIGSVIYSLPFTVQPLQNAFASISEHHLEAAATMRATPWDRFWTIAVPLARPGFLTAAVLSFAHTIGEFGVVLMLGGSIPGKTKVLSIAVYDYVENLEYTRAHWLAASMLVFSFLVLLILYAVNNRAGQTFKS